MLNFWIPCPKKTAFLTNFTEYITLFFDFKSTFIVIRNVLSNLLYAFSHKDCLNNSLILPLIFKPTLNERRSSFEIVLLVILVKTILSNELILSVTDYLPCGMIYILNMYLTI